MGSLGGETLEIPEIVMCRLSLGDFCRWLGFSGVNNVGEFDCVLDEEDGNIVSHEIPVSFTGVEFDGKSTDVSYCIC
jgi:hypothetical protein